MSPKTFSKRASTVSLVLLLSCVGCFAGPLPNPKLAYAGKQSYTANGQQWVRHNLKGRQLERLSSIPVCTITSVAALRKQSQRLSNLGGYIQQSKWDKDLWLLRSSPKDLLQLWFAVKAGAMTSIRASDRT